MGMGALVGGSIAMQGGSMIMGAGSSRKAAKQAKKIGKFNQQVYLQEAAETRESYQFEQKRAVKEGEQAAGVMRALAGASGARLDVGAPLRAEAELANELNIDQLLIAYEGENAARRSENQAIVAKMGGSLAAREHNANAVSTLLSGGASILGTLANAGGAGKASSGTSNFARYGRY
jgi:hypothetical protein